MHKSPDCLLYATIEEEKSNFKRTLATYIHRKQENVKRAKIVRCRYVIRGAPTHSLEEEPVVNS